LAARDPAVARIAASIAAQARHHPDADRSQLESDLQAARIEAAAQKVADSLPPLTAEQRARIGALLMPALVGLAAEAADAAT
jgi:hypothetical protein